MEYYEFFAGGGMARLGLGDGWKCVFANDIDERKGDCYRYNFKGAPELRVSDLAGNGAGLKVKVE
jgi:DNA (cytosine-5)-methyltransferase 1